jgi:GT2 family glycosyltransferase
MRKIDTLVVTPTLGTREASLRKTIEMVEKVGGHRVNHVLVAPISVCDDLRAKFPKLEVIDEPENCKSIYTALNYAISASVDKYKYYTYINDDDYWLPNFHFLFDVLDKEEHIDVVYAKTQFVDEKSNIIGSQTSWPFYQLFDNLLQANIVLFTQQATLLRSEWFIKMAGFDEQYKLVADTDFWLRIINSGAKLKFVNQVCAAYMIQDGQLSANSTLQSTEHTKLLKLHNLEKINLSVLLIKVAFRIFNFRIYFNRIINRQKIKPSLARKSY